MVTPEHADGVDPLLGGELVYSDNCAGCHGSSGEGISGPRLTDVLDASYPNNTELQTLLLAGRGAMPSFAGRLNSAEIDSVIFYLRQRFS